MDAPAHFIRGRWYINEVPIERMIAPAVVVDVSQQAAQNRDYEMTVDDLLEWEDLHGSIPDGAIVFLFADWASRWPDEELYLGNADGDTTDMHYPGFSIEAAQWLVDNRVIYGVATDCASPDHGPSQDFPVHVLLLNLNIYSIENVNSLWQLPPVGATVYAMPMKIVGGSGAPCRLTAQLPLDADDSSGAMATSLLLIYDARLLALLVALCYKLLL